jgi:hypothetical protein
MGENVPSPLHVFLRRIGGDGGQPSFRPELECLTWNRWTAYRECLSPACGHWRREIVVMPRSDDRSRWARFLACAADPRNWRDRLGQIRGLGFIAACFYHLLSWAMCDLIGRAIDQAIPRRRVLGGAGASALAAVLGKPASAAEVAQQEARIAQAKSAAAAFGTRLLLLGTAGVPTYWPNTIRRVTSSACGRRCGLSRRLRGWRRQAASGSAGPAGSTRNDEDSARGLSDAPAFRPRHRLP